MNEMLITLGLFLLAILVVLLLPLWRVDRKNAVLVAVIVSAIAIFLYGFTGSPRVVPLVAAYRTDMESLDKAIAATSEMITLNPNNLEAWLTLSQMLMDKGDYAAAAEGFRRAVLLSHGHPRIIIGYAEALILVAEGRVTDKAKESINAALLVDKEMPLARYYDAVWKLQNGKQDEAMQEMKALYHELPDTDPLKQKMKEQIGRK